MPTISAAMVSRLRALAEPRWSPDGQWLAYLESFDGRGDIMLVPAGGGATRRLTSEPGAQRSASYGGGVYCWVNPKLIAFASPDGQLYAQPVVGGLSRKLTDVSGRCTAPVASADGSRLAVMVSTHDSQSIAVVPTAGPHWPSRVSHGGDFTFDPCWSPDGHIAWHEWSVPNMSWDGGQICMASPLGEVTTVDGGPDISVSQPRFSPDGSALTYISDRGGWWNIWLFDVSKGKTRPLVEEEAEHGGPVWGPGGMRYAWSPTGGEIAFIRTSEGRSTVQIVDVTTGDRRAVGPDGGSVQAVSWSPIGDRLALLWSRSDRPTRVSILHLASGALQDVALGAAEGYEAAATPAPENVTWPSTDGALVHGLLWRPRGATRPPLLVRVHGGPNGHVEAGFDPRTSYWVDRGWAVLQVNYRGSSGYGRAYLQALRNNWCILDANDAASGARHLAQSGWVDGDRMAITGGSAGGTTTLLALAHHPDVFAAGIDLYGVADLFALSEQTHRFEAHYLDTMIGPLPDSYALYRDRSPVNLTDRITKPLLILQGDSDEVVPRAQSEAIQRRLEGRDVPVELVIYEGEGHGWHKISTVEDELARSERFLKRHVLRIAT
ncbi:MAG: prolyl oligopeptidase family serine peptidase [Chloroflexota bacterium]